MIGPSFSGATLSFGENLVVKKARGLVGMRLIEQFELLRSFACSVPGVRVPRAGILSSIREGDDLVELFVERVHGPGVFLACDNWELHMQKLIEFVVDELERSRAYACVGEDMERKLFVLEASMTFSEKDELIDTNRLHLASVVAPIGPCHGDLTLCNVLCGCESGSVGDIVLVDTIKPFLLTPFQDIAKIKQDTHHGWIERHVSGVDPARVRACADMIDTTFSAMSYDVAAFEILTLLRIFPYARGNDDVYSWIKQEVRRCQSSIPSS